MPYRWWELSTGFFAFLRVVNSKGLDDTVSTAKVATCFGSSDSKCGKPRRVKPVGFTRFWTHDLWHRPTSASTVDPRRTGVHRNQPFRYGRKWPVRSGASDRKPGHLFSYWSMAGTGLLPTGRSRLRRLLTGELDMGRPKDRALHNSPASAVIKGRVPPRTDSETVMT